MPINGCHCHHNLMRELRSIGDLGLDRGAYKALLEAKKPPAEPFSSVFLLI